MRAGLVFVIAALLAGGGFREWRRSHEERFQDLVAELEARDSDWTERDSSRAEAAGGSDLTNAWSGSNRDESRGGRTSSVPVGKVDPNRAGAAELERLPGIGPALAARIVADRKSHGGFAAPESLLRVPGIGPRTLERIRPHLDLSPAARGESLRGR